MKRMIASAPLLLALVGCGGDDGEATGENDDASRPASTATATVTVTATPEPVQQDGVLKLGESADVGFAQITALELRGNVPVDNFPSQKRWAAVLVKTCAKVSELDGEPLLIGWAPWTVSDSDDGLYQVTGVTGGIAYPVPTYPLDPPQRLAKGQCVKGWIPFNVAPGAKLATVNYSSESAPEPVTWKF